MAMNNRERNERQRQADLRKELGLPYRCECGGVIHYEREFNQIFSHCKKCTPVEVVRLPNRKGTA
jgi:predicted SprT family Zn-dependent metalloprotease